MAKQFSQPISPSVIPGVELERSRLPYKGAEGCSGCSGVRAQQHAIKGNSDGPRPWCILLTKKIAEGEGEVGVRGSEFLPKMGQTEWQANA